MEAAHANWPYLLFSIQHNKTAVLVTEDMKKMVQIPILRPRPAKNTKVFGASLSELQDRGLVEDGVPVVLRRLVEHLRRHGEKRLWRFVSCFMLPCFLLSAIQEEEPHSSYSYHSLGVGSFVYTLFPLLGLIPFRCPSWTHNLTWFLTSPKLPNPKLLVSFL